MLQRVDGMSYEDAVSTISHTELYVVGALLCTLSLVGTAGNALVIYVFSTTGRKDELVSNLFILVLALVDFTTCLVIMPFTVFMESVEFTVSSDTVCKLYQFLITFNIPFSSLIMAAIAVDRCAQRCILCYTLLNSFRIDADTDSCSEYISMSTVY